MPGLTSVNESSRRGYASQAITGQLLLALIFDESACETRDRALVAAVGAVNASFGCNLKSLDEQLARQLQARPSVVCSRWPCMSQISAWPFLAAS